MPTTPSTNKFAVLRSGKLYRAVGLPLGHAMTHRQGHRNTFTVFHSPDASLRVRGLPCRFLSEAQSRATELRDAAALLRQAAEAAEKMADELDLKI